MAHAARRVWLGLGLVAVLGASLLWQRSAETAAGLPRIAITEDVAAGRNWALRTADGHVAWNTLREAYDACASLGPGWGLPVSASGFPALDPAPSWPAEVQLWLNDGATAWVGLLGRAPRAVAAVADTGQRAAVLCVR